MQGCDNQLWDFLEWTNKQDRVLDFIKCAYHERPNRPDIKALHDEFSSDHDVNQSVVQHISTWKANRTMKLTGEQIAQIEKAIVEAYNVDGLRRAVRVHMDVSLQTIVGGETFNNVVFNLIDWAEKNACIGRLVKAVCADNPNHPLLARVAQDFADWSDETTDDVELAAARRIVSEYLRLWLDSNQSGRGETLIPYTEFRKVDRHRAAFASESKPVRTYLLRCAVQNGMSGQWGKWLLLNFDNEMIVAPLIRAFTAVAGERPLWRSAAILQQYPSICIAPMFAHLDEMLARQIGYSGYSLAFFEETLSNRSVVMFLEQRAADKAAEDKARSGARQVLEEILSFTPELSRFRDEQSICTASHSCN